MLATKLIVAIANNNNENTDVFEVYEFQNGLIFVECPDTCHFFHEDRESIQTNNYSRITGISETKDGFEWSLEDLQETIRVSLADWGTVSPKALAMLS